MTVRIWAGWLLVFAGIGILMIIGCEKGGLGVRGSIVKGTIVDAEQPATPIVGATVLLLAETGLPIGQEYSVTTDVNGRYLFENVISDKMKLEVRKSGYTVLKYPDTAIATASTLAYFWVNNGVTVDLGVLAMIKDQTALATTTISVKGKMLDSISKDELATTQVISIYFDGKKYENRDITYLEFKNGLSIPAKFGNYVMTVITANYETFKSSDPPAVSISGGVDNVLTVNLIPRSYSVRVSLKNKPGYLDDKVVELVAGAFAQSNRTKCNLSISSAVAQAGKPYKVLATATLSLNEYLPQIVMPGISLPASLTINLSGYTEMVFQVPPYTDTQGIIDMPLDLASGAVPSFGVSIANRMITRPFLVTVNPKAETNASDVIPLTGGSLVLIRCLNQQWGEGPLAAFENAPPTKPLPCGYIIPFEVKATTVSGISNTTNFYYIDPVFLPPGQETSLATFTARLLIAKGVFLTRP